MSNILVTGSNGQLGSEFRSLEESNQENNFFFTDRNELDITDKSALDSFIKTNKIDTIVNCAAYTAVDKAEEDRESAKSINQTAVSYLAEIAKKYSLKLVHISTDYVFDGEHHTPYMESDKPKPKSIYGETKLSGEQEILTNCLKNSCIIRTSWVYSSYGNNFVKTMIRLGKEKESLGVIYDQVGTPTYAKDLAKAILEIIPKLECSEAQVYHYSNEGVLSWFDFAKEIMRMAKLDCKINPIETKDYPTAAKRPHYSLLNKSKIKKDFNIEIPYWKDSLESCLTLMKERR